MLDNPVATKAALATPAPMIPIAPHKSQAGKNAPNKSKDGAPLLAQPPRQVVVKHRAIANGRERIVTSRAKDARAMTINEARAKVGVTDRTIGPAKKKAQKNPTGVDTTSMATEVPDNKLFSSYFY